MGIEKLIRLSQADPDNDELKQRLLSALAREFHVPELRGFDFREASHKNWRRVIDCLESVSAERREELIKIVVQFIQDWPIELRQLPRYPGRDELSRRWHEAGLSQIAATLTTINYSPNQVSKIAEGHAEVIALSSNDSGKLRESARFPKLRQLTLARNSQFLQYFFNASAAACETLLGLEKLTLSGLRLNNTRELLSNELCRKNMKQLSIVYGRKVPSVMFALDWPDLEVLHFDIDAWTLESREFEAARLPKLRRIEFKITQNHLPSFRRLEAVIGKMAEHCEVSVEVGLTISHWATGDYQWLWPYVCKANLNFSFGYFLPELENCQELAVYYAPMHSDDVGSEPSELTVAQVISDLPKRYPNIERLTLHSTVFAQAFFQALGPDQLVRLRHLIVDWAEDTDVLKFWQALATRHFETIEFVTMNAIDCDSDAVDSAFGADLKQQLSASKTRISLRSDYAWLIDLLADSRLTVKELDLFCDNTSLDDLRQLLSLKQCLGIERLYLRDAPCDLFEPKFWQDHALELLNDFVCRSMNRDCDRNALLKEIETRPSLIYIDLD